MVKKLMVILFSFFSGAYLNSVSRVNYVKINLNQTACEYRQITKPQTPVNKPKIKEENLTSNYWELKEVFTLTNALREMVGNKALIWDEKLTSLANIRAQEIAESGFFEHLRPDGRKVETLLGDNQVHFQIFGENIAKGYKSPEEVVKAWQNSLGHYQNMIKAKYKKMGVGKATINNKVYWVQFFTN